MRHKPPCLCLTSPPIPTNRWRLSRSRPAPSRIGKTAPCGGHGGADTIDGDGIRGWIPRNTAERWCLVVWGRAGRQKGTCHECKAIWNAFAGAPAAVLATASMSGVVASWASAADAPSGRSGVLSVSGRYGNRALAGCDYYQINTPPPVGDHRWAVNNTCDGGIQHWFVIGNHTYYGPIMVRPSDPSDSQCRKINSFGTQVVSPIGGSCWFVPSDELPLISDWGNLFGVA